MKGWILDKIFLIPNHINNGKKQKMTICVVLLGHCCLSSSPVGASPLDEGAEGISHHGGLHLWPDRGKPQTHTR